MAHVHFPQESLRNAQKVITKHRKYLIKCKGQVAHNVVEVPCAGGVR